MNKNPNAIIVHKTADVRIHLAKTKPSPRCEGL